MMTDYVGNMTWVLCMMTLCGLYDDGCWTWVGQRHIWSFRIACYTRKVALSCCHDPIPSITIQHGMQMLETTRCAFGNCRHLDEPGCAVRGDWERYEFYAALRMELQELADVAKSRATSKRQRQGALRYVFGYSVFPLFFHVVHVVSRLSPASVYCVNSASTSNRQRSLHVDTNNRLSFESFV